MEKIRYSHVADVKYYILIHGPHSETISLIKDWYMRGWERLLGLKYQVRFLINFFIFAL